MVHGKWIFYTENLDDVQKVLAAVYGPGLEMTDDDFYAFNIVIYENDAPVCCGRLDHKNDAFTVGRLCTVPDKRGKGYADLALRMIIRKSFDMGAKSISITVGDKEAEYFMRIGFKAVERTEKGLLLTKFEDVGGCC